MVDAFPRRWNYLRPIPKPRADNIVILRSTLHSFPPVSFLLLCYGMTFPVAFFYY
ncbi:hypothetical protein BDV27DRAFT_128249 [Aspergillus caelatus]|uniref:Uncharacterized protein n=1 Tax=Aspergillus caelatus TaxID=61420 RepID=A0A5N7A402_9EURO|nr:uncharacterized protein BDV27DRAFT_128249 [Aspergillus caelatus]KAE8364587.1 hypothetical protein BDV27DRAFT_128249 [Aspergillus caelatus]